MEAIPQELRRRKAAALDLSANCWGSLLSPFVFSSPTTPVPFCHHRELDGVGGARGWEGGKLISPWVRSCRAFYREP